MEPWAVRRYYLTHSPQRYTWDVLNMKIIQTGLAHDGTQRKTSLQVKPDDFIFFNFPLNDNGNDIRGRPPIFTPSCVEIGHFHFWWHVPSLDISAAVMWPSDLQMSSVSPTRFSPLIWPFHVCCVLLSAGNVYVMLSDRPNICHSKIL